MNFIGSLHYHFLHKEFARNKIPVLRRIRTTSKIGVFVFAISLSVWTGLKTPSSGVEVTIINPGMLFE
jgi:hypothetical protein